MLEKSDTAALYVAQEQFSLFNDMFNNDHMRVKMNDDLIHLYLEIRKIFIV